MLRRFSTALSTVLATITSSALASPANLPQLVSPAGPGEARVGSGCPTFSWTAVPEASAYELVVFDADDGSHEDSARLRVRIPAGASSWTPNLDQCLPAPGRYGWSVGAIVAGELRWSATALVRVVEAAAAPPLRNRQDAARAPLAAQRSAHERRAGSSHLSLPTAPPGLRNRVAPAFEPRTCTGAPAFSDVPNDDFFCPWIEQAATDGVVSGCGGGKYCPDHPVTRRQLALALERVMRGTDSWNPELGNGATPSGPPTSFEGGVVEIGGELYHSDATRLSITIGVDGLPILTLPTDDDEDLMVAHCSDPACDGMTVTRLDNPAPNDGSSFTGGHSSIAIRHDGRPVISYSDEAGLKVATCANVACTSASSITAVGGTSEGFFNQIVVPQDGLPAIAWYDNGNLMLTRCVTSACTAFDPPVSLDDSVRGISMAALGEQLWISYVRGSTLRVLTCSSLFCDITAITQDLDADAGNFEPETSIVIGDDLLPLISYASTDYGELRVAHCEDTQCGTWNIESVAPDFSAPGVSSVAIGANGLPVVAFTGNSTRFALCRDPVCSASTLVGGGSGGGAPVLGLSLTIGADGLPVVVAHVWDEGAEYASVARCPNALCKPFFRRR